MKKIFCKLTLVFTVLAIASTGVYAQQNFGEKWGPTPEKQKENVTHFNFYRDAYNNNDYDEALKYLPGLIENAPRGSQNTYVYAINIYKDKILKATSLADKKEFVGKLMELYDYRVTYFGDDANRGKGYILALKADDYATYNPADRENVVKYYKDAVDANGDKVDTELVNRYFSELTNDYLDDLVESDDYLEEYDRLEAVMNLPANADKTQDRNTFEALFIKSGAANCENLEKMFAPRVAENPTDIALLEKAAGLLARGNCKGDFYFDVAEKLYEANPSSNTAMILAAGYEERKDYAKSLQYLNAALANETDPELKVNLAIRIAASELGAGNSRSAADFARQAISLSSDNGYAYYILAQTYAVGASQCTEFNRQSVYWLAYDTLLTAKRLLAGDESQVGDLDSQLARFRANFPTKEECFWRELKEGASYHVSCGWISGSTTVRPR